MLVHLHTHTYTPNFHRSAARMLTQAVAGAVDTGPVCPSSLGLFRKVKRQAPKPCKAGCKTQPTLRQVYFTPAGSAINRWNLSPYLFEFATECSVSGRDGFKCVKCMTQFSTSDLFHAQEHAVRHARAEIKNQVEFKGMEGCPGIVQLIKVAGDVYEGLHVPAGVYDKFRHALVGLENGQRFFLCLGCLDYCGTKLDHCKMHWTRIHVNGGTPILHKRSCYMHHDASGGAGGNKCNRKLVLESPVTDLQESADAQRQPLYSCDECDFVACDMVEVRLHKSQAHVPLPTGGPAKKEGRQKNVWHTGNHLLEIGELFDGRSCAVWNDHANGKLDLFAGQKKVTGRMRRKERPASERPCEKKRREGLYIRSGCEEEAVYVGHGSGDLLSLASMHRGASLREKCAAVPGVVHALCGPAEDAASSSSPVPLGNTGQVVSHKFEESSLFHMHPKCDDGCVGWDFDPSMCCLGYDPLFPELEGDAANFSEVAADGAGSWHAWSDPEACLDFGTAAEGGVWHGSGTVYLGLE